MSDKIAATELDRLKETQSLKQSSLGIKNVFLGVLILALLVFPAFQFLSGRLNYWLHMGIYLFMYIAMTSSWNIIGGYAGYTSLGHNVFFAVGAYVSGVLLIYFGVSPFLSAPLGGLISIVIGLLVGLISLRTRGPAFIISTIAMILVIRISFDNWDYIGGSNGMSLQPIGLPLAYNKMPFYYAMLLIAAGAVYLAYRIRHSKFGLGLRAISQDETKAEVAGIPTNWYKILAFAISGLFVGMAGGLWGYYLTYLLPSIFLSILVAAQMVLMAVLGGKGTVAGPVIGAVLFIAINEFFVSNLGFTELNIVATGFLMLMVLLFFPEGIVGTLREKNRLPQILDWD
jgi:branched-chain amino acid transport system permease protein